jgi:4'-phosphopantetheinyl transferase
LIYAGPLASVQLDDPQQRAGASEWSSGMTSRASTYTPASASYRAPSPMSCRPSHDEACLLTLRLDGAEIADDDIATLAADERRRAAGFATPHVRQQYMACRIALRKMVALCTDVAAADVRFVYSPLGKPLCADTSRRLAISVSHSGNVGVIAIAGDDQVGAAARLGVDIERVDPDVDAVGLAHTAFAPEEIAELRRLDAVAGDDVAGHDVMGHDAARTELFYRLWTHREAVAKALGIGLRGDPAQLCVDVTSRPGPRIVRISDNQRDLADWTLRDIDVRSGDVRSGDDAIEYRAALAIDRPLRHIERFECQGLTGLVDALRR